jgi:F-box-like
VLVMWSEVRTVRCPRVYTTCEYRTAPLYILHFYVVLNYCSISTPKAFFSTNLSLIRHTRKCITQPSSSSQSTIICISHHSASRVSPIPIDGLSEICNTERGVERYRYVLRVAPATMTYLCGPGQISPRVTIGTLPDDVLLDIFDFCRKAENPYLWPPWPPWPAQAWRTLTHVCQRWRYVVFASPNRLNLVLLCTERTHVREMLNLWPPLPIELRSEFSGGEDKVVAALKHHDRVRRIRLVRRPPVLERFAAVMQEPFPELSFLQLISYDEYDKTPAALPDTFLGGSAPRLRKL